MKVKVRNLELDILPESATCDKCMKKAEHIVYDSERMFFEYMCYGCAEEYCESFAAHAARCPNCECMFGVG